MQSTEVAGLVYVDAAFNRADGSEDYDAVAARLPPVPAPQAEDLASVTALRAFRMKNEGAALPEAHADDPVVRKNVEARGSPRD